ncbi:MULTISPECIES: hypothetical protein [Sphingomonadales]|uniref:Uncharacterized protein n=2 Tax=Sphingomonadales TaxID=204457 RepID=A0A0G3XL70_9SPHN|nr:MULTISPECIES: hypothetical protein [Sphingomonadales]EZP69629.1 hypothetical protein BV96_04032 [Sphingomonas paucimobilis]AIT82718.1 hypothetical protein JI59_25040 [Novosphingobium pentaromativorans US6-1]AKM11982.1 hypothetical protein AB433_17675 [Croceicoccus naphthovorans]AKM12136.1 hypothetical protein AB433_18590 [Croceicoccus naphthovorans]EHJ57908.1 hypothetical protein NSU_pLA1014 [Novosphingobium pentaromativorans US6-1]
MNALTKSLDIPAFDPISYDAAVRAATIRAQHSFFDSHVIENDDGSFSAIDEGDYNALPQDLIDRIVHSVPGMMADDFDEANIARAASFMSVVMDPDWDADCPF